MWNLHNPKVPGWYDIYYLEVARVVFVKHACPPGPSLRDTDCTHQNLYLRSLTVIARALTVESLNAKYEPCSPPSYLYPSSTPPFIPPPLLPPYTPPLLPSPTARAVLKCSGGTDCFGSAAPITPGTEDCNLTRTATVGTNVTLDSSLLFSSGGLKRHEVRTVSVQSTGIGLISCSAANGNCTGSGVGLDIQSVHDGLMDIKLLLHNVAPSHNGTYMVTVVTTTGLGESTSEILHCLRYHLTVHGM